VDLWKKIGRWIEDPPPEFVFEVSEAGLAWVRRSTSVQPAFLPLSAGVLDLSPLKDNVVDADALSAAIRSLVNGAGQRKRRSAAVILPDYCARVAVLDFDSFPSSAEEQASLVRFRAKRTAPFDLDSAALGFFVQPRPGTKRYDVVVAAISLEILARYEAAFRAANLHPGFVTVSTLAALELIRADGLTLTARMAGQVLTVVVQQARLLRLWRCVELPELHPEEVMNVLHPTIAYTEDEFGQRPSVLHLCGFSPELTAALEPEVGIPVEPLRSRIGAPGAYNAGLLGYLEATGA